MGHVVPHNLRVLQSSVCVTPEELSHSNETEAFRRATTDLFGMLQAQIFKSCPITTRRAPETDVTILSVKVYVLTPEELQDIIAKAMETGRRDFMRYTSFKL